MHESEPTGGTYGVMAEFDSAQTLVDAARQTVARGLHEARGAIRLSRSRS